jgi:hypothetical protein
MGNGNPWKSKYWGKEYNRQEKEMEKLLVWVMRREGR